MPRQTELASTKPMDEGEALRFLVRLANANIDELKRTPDDPEGLPAILYGLRRYLNIEGDEGETAHALEKARSRPDNLKKPISKLKRLLDAVAEERFEDTEFTLTRKRTVRLRVEGGELISLRGGDWGEALIDYAIEDLAGTDVKLLRVGHCRRTGCDRLFYKLKINQSYCDHRCANRAAADRRAAKIGAQTTKARKLSKQEGAQS